MVKLILLVGMPMMISGVVSSDILIESFADPILSWYALNDPIMGGESVSNVTVDADQGLGILEGHVVSVPFLRAPGFITMKTNGGSYPDVSSCQALKLTLRATKPYSGHSISFGHFHVPEGRFAFGYKSTFSPPLDDFGDIILPFHEFSAKWDDITGNITETCADDPNFCPTEKALRDLETITIWGEGVVGDIHLEIQNISATQCFEGNANGTNPTPSSNGTSEDSGVDVPPALGEEVIIESFANSSLNWTTLNDTVMGGESRSSFSINETGVGVFTGEVVDVPSLNAPGFIQVVGKGHFPDLSHCEALKITAMSAVEYYGYQVSFGQKQEPDSVDYIHGFKAKFAPPVDGFRDIVIPFADFSDKWDPFRGDQLVTCKESAQFCPDESTLQNLKEFAIFGAGVEGVVDLQIKSISAVGCNDQSKPPTEEEASRTGQEKTESQGIPSTFLFSGVVVATVVVLVVVRQYHRLKYDQLETTPETLPGTAAEASPEVVLGTQA